MGGCFSKKKKVKPPSSSLPTTPNDPPKVKKVVEQKERNVAATPPAPEPIAAEKKPVFVITQSKKLITTAAPVAAIEEENKKGEILKKNQQEDRCGLPAMVPEEQAPVPVRTSSCTKEEVDAILIQCGRLSRSSSGKASNETGGGGRRYSGSKRSFDFDEERRRGGEEEEWEKPVSRPSPHRRTPGRERSGSRERGSSGGRRVSRSPGRRSEGPSSSCSAGERLKQPGKMVSVPPREKAGGGTSDAGTVGVRRASPAVPSKRSASPRSRSPANPARASNENAIQCYSSQNQPQSLSRSSSKKADQSPYRRNPLAEIDENSLKEEEHHPARNLNGGSSTKVLRSKEANQSQAQKGIENISQTRRTDSRNPGAADVPTKNSNVISQCVREQLVSCRAKEELQPEPEKKVDEAIERKGVSKATDGVESLDSRTITRSRSSRRSSRDLDHALGLNSNTYASLLLEDIHNYHLQNTAFSLPACVSKACSILEAVADLNSSFSDNKSYGEDRSNNENGSHNVRYGLRGLAAKESFMESEIVVKDDLMEPSLHKYVAVRDMGEEMEPQESAGSNSFVGQPWTSPCEPNSVDSTDHCWTTSRSNTGEEVEEEELSPVDRNHHQQFLPDAHVRKSRGGYSAGNSNPNALKKKREVDRRQLRRAGSGVVPAATS